LHHKGSSVLKNPALAWMPTDSPAHLFVPADAFDPIRSLIAE
jgi:hypothetical protein